MVAAALSGGVLLLGALLAGCGGDESAPAEPATAAAAPTATVGYGEALPLRRFHYVVMATVRGQPQPDKSNAVVVTTEGDFEWPDRHAFTRTVEVGPVVQTRSAVIVGERAWLLAGDAGWQALARLDPAVQELIAASYSSAREHFLDSSWYQNVRQAAARLEAPEELINGVQTSRYHVGPEGEAFFRKFLADDPLVGGRQQPSWDVWLANDGLWPVRLVLAAQLGADAPGLAGLGVAGPAAIELRIDVSRPDDPTLTVQAPG
jgi:hypothetical protein